MLIGIKHRYLLASKRKHLLYCVQRWLANKIFINIYISDWFWVNIFWFGSGLFFTARLRSGWVSHFWFGFGKFALKIPNFPIFSLLGQKVPGSKTVGLLFTACQNYAWVGSGPISNLYHKKFMNFPYFWSFIFHIFPFVVILLHFSFISLHFSLFSAIFHKDFA